MREQNPPKLNFCLSLRAYMDIAKVIIHSFKVFKLNF